MAFHASSVPSTGAAHPQINFSTFNKTSDSIYLFWGLTWLSFFSVPLVWMSVTSLLAHSCLCFAELFLLVPVAFAVSNTVTELQAHRRVAEERCLWRSSCPAALLSQGQLESVAQDHVQVAFNCLQAWRLHLSGQSVPVLSHRHSEKCFPAFRATLLCFSLCPLPLILALGTTGQSLAPSSLHLPFRY